MKKIALFSFLVLAGLEVAAQNVVVWGKVSNPESDSILLAIPENPFNAREQKTYAKLNDKNEFRLTVDLKQPVLADLENSGDAMTLFLQPGDNLEIKFKASDMVKTIKFAGQGAAENNYMRDQEKKFDNNEDYQVLPDNIYFREEGFVKFIDAKKE
ncbi:MAG TPA: hypothetical protein VK927_11640, partial [Adhaeribacter sp.]|nr:hypothetical protein [Adhaeribacter sp.]